MGTLKLNGRESFLESPQGVEPPKDTAPCRNVRLRIGLPPVASKPLEQSLRSWLFARKFFGKPVSATRHGPILTVREHPSAVGRTDPWFFCQNRADAERMAYEFLRFAWQDFTGKTITNEEKDNG